MLLLSVFAVASWFASVEQALAQTCMGSASGLDLSNGCTANDTRVASFALLSGPTTCVPGDTINVTLQAALTAGTTRYDVGIYVAQDGGDASGTGACLHDYLPPPLQPSNAPTCAGTCSVSATSCQKDADCPSGETCTGGYNPSSGTGPFWNGECGLDPTDTCGDLEPNLNPLVPVLKNLGATNIKCVDDGMGNAVVSACVSWDNQASNGDNKPSCTSVNQTVPAEKSKCQCNNVNVGSITIVTPTPTPTATSTPTATPTSTDTPTNSPTQSPTNTPTATPTATSTATNAQTSTPTPTPTATPTATNTPTNTPIASPTNTQTPTRTPTATATQTPTPTASPTITATFMEVTPEPEVLTDLAIKKTHNKDFVIGATASYFITVKNLGTPTTKPIEVTDVLPTGLTFASASGAGWDCSGSAGSNVDCTNPIVLNMGDQVPLTINVSVGQGVLRNFVNTAKVTKQPDEVFLLNNVANDPTSIAEAGFAPAPVLSPFGLVLAVCILAGIGFVTLRRSM